MPLIKRFVFLFVCFQVAEINFGWFKQKQKGIFFFKSNTGESHGLKKHVRNPKLRKWKNWGLSGDPTVGGPGSLTQSWPLPKLVPISQLRTRLSHKIISQLEGIVIGLGSLRDLTMVHQP